TKQVLNLISTGVMIRLGKVYGNLMVDVSVNNSKLRERAERLITEITGVEPRRAGQFLEQAGWRVPVAVLMIEQGLDRPQAESRLVAAGGVLRTALAQA